MVNPHCHIVCLPIAPHILLLAQVHLATVTPAQQQIAPPCLVSSKLPKEFRKIKKKIVKVFARFSENVLYFCRPHPPSVVVANFCGCIFFYPCSEKIIKKNSEKIKSLIPTGAFLKNQEKIQEKGKNRVICLFCAFFPSPFVFTLLRYVSTRLSQQL
jgi:hypothetical protein